MADPDQRLPDGFLSLNEELLRGTIRHAVYLQRLKAQLARETVGFLNRQVFPDVIDKLISALERIDQRGAASGVWKTKRYRAMVEDLSEILDGGYKSVHAKLAKALKEAAKIEATFAAKQIVSTAPVQLSMGLPTASTLNAIVTAQPFQGALLGDWFDDLGKKTQTRLVQQVNIGLVEGETIQDIARRIRGTRANAFSDGVLQTSRREAEMLARTATAETSSRAREAAYGANEDVVGGVEIVATLDHLTCPICAVQDGKVYKVGDGPRPPFHPSCRCSHSPVTKSWKELGIDLKEAPEGTRASMSGEAPDAMTFPAWLKEQSAQAQDDVLGVTRGRLWRSGELEFSQFVDDRGRLMTLAELARVEGVEIPSQYMN